MTEGLNQPVIVSEILTVAPITYLTSERHEDFNKVRKLVLVQ